MVGEEKIVYVFGTRRVELNEDPKGRHSFRYRERKHNAVSSVSISVWIIV